MSLTGDPEGRPFRLGVAISDIVTGMFAAQAITSALFARERTGRGQYLDIAMLDSTVALLTYQASIYLATGASPVRMGNRHPTIVPYETFPTADGELVLAVGNDDLWRRFCRVAGLDALATDSRFATNPARVSHYAELHPLLAARLRTRPRADWIAALMAEGVPCGAIRDVGEVLSDAHIRERGMLATLDHAALGPVSVLGSPLQLSETPTMLRSAPPALGQHTELILRGDLGLSEEEIATLKRQNVV